MLLLQFTSFDRFPGSSAHGSSTQTEQEAQGQKALVVSGGRPTRGQLPRRDWHTRQSRSFAGRLLGLAESNEIIFPFLSSLPPVLLLMSLAAVAEAGFPFYGSSNCLRGDKGSRDRGGEEKEKALF